MIDEKRFSITYGCLGFLDSINGMKMSLDAMLETRKVDVFVKTWKMFGDK